MNNLDQLQTALSQGRALKIISGITNFNADRVDAVVKSATQGGATFLDIAADPQLVQLAKSLTHLPICVSAITAEAFVAPVTAGADLIEIGNYEAFYSQGLNFSATDVLALTADTRKLLPTITLSVTVPHKLPLDQQVQLAVDLEKAGANIIQTEGAVSSNPSHAGVLGLIEKAAPTLAAAYEISRAVSIPVLCASGISSVTAPLAIAAGAAGVGVGAAVNRLDNEVAMIAVIRSLVESLATVNKVTVNA